MVKSLDKVVRSADFGEVFIAGIGYNNIGKVLANMPLELVSSRIANLNCHSVSRLFYTLRKPMVISGFENARRIAQKGERACDTNLIYREHACQK